VGDFAVTPRERLEAAFAIGLAKLPLPAQRLLGSTPIEIEGMRLHPTSQLLVKLERLAGIPGYEDLTPAAAREQTGKQGQLLTGPKLPLERVEDLALSGPAGEIPARLYAPAPQPGSGGLLVYYHGGGHVIGSLDTHDSASRPWSRSPPGSATRRRPPSSC
jgi:acetyl esterase